MRMSIFYGFCTRVEYYFINARRKKKLALRSVVHEVQVYILLFILTHKLTSRVQLKF